MIKRLDLFVIKSFIGPLILTFFIAEFVLIMQFLWLHIEDLVGKGLGFNIIAELFLSIAASLVNMALPLAILLASVMTFGNMGEHFELSAMKSAGLSLQRIMLPLMMFSVLLGIGAFYWANNIVPYANLKAFSLIYDVGKMRPELNIVPGIFYNNIEDFSIKIGNKNNKTAMMYDCMIYDHSAKKGNLKLTLSDSGMMHLTDNQKYMILTLYNGRNYEDMQENNQDIRKYPERHETFDKQTIIFELKGFGLERTDNALFKPHYQMKTVFELAKSIDSLKIALILRQKRFEKELYAFGFHEYHKIHMIAKDSMINGNAIYPDSSHKHFAQIVSNVDQFIESSNQEEVKLVLNEALKKVQNSRNYIESNKIEIEERQKNIYRHQSALHQKIAFSLACLIFFFIGAPLGAIIRKGGFGLPIIASIVFFIVYYIISIFGRKLVEEGSLAAWLGIWLSSFITMPVGIFLMFKASNDSSLLDIRTFIDFLKKPFKKYNKM